LVSRALRSGYSLFERMTGSIGRAPFGESRNSVAKAPIPGLGSFCTMLPMPQDSPTAAAATHNRITTEMHWKRSRDLPDGRIAPGPAL